MAGTLIRYIHDVCSPAQNLHWKLGQQTLSAGTLLAYTSVRKYWKILFYPSNTDTGTFYGGSTDIDTDAQYPKYSTDILVFLVFYSISILCLKPLIDSCYLRLLAL